MSDHRLERLRTRMAKEGIAALLVVGPENRRYLSGFTGTAATLLILPEEAHLLTDFRYIEQAKAQAPGYTVHRHTTADELLQQVARLASEAGIDRIGFEAAHVSFERYRRWQEGLKGIGLVETVDLVESIRLVKEPEEVERVERAMAIAHEAFTELLPLVRPGVRERDLALELEFLMRRRGASAKAFDFIIASGWRSALPHGVAGDKEIAAGELVTFDFGCVYEGYHSDMTRTVAVGDPDPEQRRIYEVVLRAQLAGVEAVRPGVSGREVDGVSRRVIEEAGFGEAFGHGTGHGVGLEIHEAPRLSPTGDTYPLQPGMIVTVEPGIYLPGLGGVRIEDTLLVTEEGSRNLALTSKELLIL